MVWKMLYNHCRTAAVGAKPAASSPHCHVGRDRSTLKPPQEEMGQKGQVGEPLHGEAPGSLHPVAHSCTQAGCDFSIALLVFNSARFGGPGNLYFDKGEKMKERKPPSPRLGDFHFNFLLGGARSPEAQGSVRDRPGGSVAPVLWQWPLTTCPRTVAKSGPWTLVPLA